MTTQPQSPSEQEIEEKVREEIMCLDLGYKYRMSDYATNRNQEAEMEREGLVQVDGAIAAIMKIIAQAADKREQEATRRTLLGAAAILSGIGSKGDKVNGNPHFMMGVQAAEDCLTEYANDLPALRETLSDPVIAQCMSELRQAAEGEGKNA